MIKNKDNMDNVNSRLHVGGGWSHVAARPTTEHVVSNSSLDVKPESQLYVAESPKW